MEINASSHWTERFVLRGGSSTGVTTGDEPLVHVLNDEDTDEGGAFGSTDEEILVAESIAKIDFVSLGHLVCFLVLWDAWFGFGHFLRTLGFGWLPWAVCMFGSLGTFDGGEWLFWFRLVGFYVWLRFQFVWLGKSSPRFYVAEILLALEYLRMLGIIYKDLKTENVLVRDDGWSYNALRF
ncbi:hypothetical protein GIB67_015685 [Kingdonia uniflora]|uniref:non-specific serine/threonine protein kinase n=1 Tax=Kingdonia uniflora TaxID=39325 RepID=A0A7J7NUE9_9MAGN|nr:hypothetical protein GIB67_015685 [Kingdonia uniflora]